MRRAETHSQRILVTLILLFASASVVFCGNYYVATTGNDSTGDGSQGNPWKTITHAVAMANPTRDNPVSIYVAGGIYSTNLTGEQFPLKLKSFLSLIGESDSLTILDAISPFNSPRRVMTCDSVTSVSIEGFTMMRGHAAAEDNQNYGGGILIRASSYVSIKHNTIVRNSAVNQTGGFSSGGGIAVLFSRSILITHNRIVSNSVVADGAGGGGISFNAQHGIISYNTIDSNSAFALFGATGGGIEVSSDTALLRNNIIMHNVNAAMGGGMYASGSPLILRNTIEFDTCQFYGGGIAFGFGSPIIGGSSRNGNNIDRNSTLDPDTSYPPGRQMRQYSWSTPLINAQHNYFGAGVDPHDPNEVYGNFKVDPYSLSPLIFDTLDIVAVPGSIDLDTLTAGSQRTVSISLYNIRNSLSDSISIQSVHFRDGLTSVALSSHIILSVQTETLRVTIHPLVAGDYNDTIVVSTSVGALTIPIHAIVVKPNFEFSSLWIGLYGLPPASATVWFGNSTLNSFGLDTTGNVPHDFKEYECAPEMLNGFGVAWKPITQHQWGGISYLCDRDFRNWTTCGQIDTFKLYFNQQDAGSATISLRWADRCVLFENCDSMFLVDPTGHIPRINMFTQDSLSIPAAGDSGITSLFIYKYGIHGCCETCRRFCPLDTKEEKGVPATFSLRQNFPNPFNPSTQIQYDLPNRQYVRLVIYDVLGREIATLVDEIEEAGSYSVTWDASKIANGVYFYRLQAEHFTDVKKMILAR